MHRPRNPLKGSEPMEHRSYTCVLRTLKPRCGTDATLGPIALVLVDDPTRRDATIQHCLEAGFRTVIALGQHANEISADWEGRVHLAPFDVHRPDAYSVALNALISAVPGCWLHICYSGEYLFWPFGDFRNVRDLTCFAQEERRPSIAGIMVDLYGESAGQASALQPKSECWIDHDGYVAEPEMDVDGNALPRQLVIRGGLRLRLGYLLKARQRIDRVLLVRARHGLQMQPDLSFNFPEFNTRHCPWHSNVTAVLCSDRAARALAVHKDREKAPDRLVWRGSTRFDWSAHQLTQLGLMEPGQWV